ncbi:MAG: hypothetical protein OWU33_04670 [Firmicutes bacterium]|nr:hypothetical protein [Bacillota bacterium]
MVVAYWSAISKASLNGPVAVDAGGLAGDRQADRKNHRGVHKAIYAHFQSNLDSLARLVGGDELDPGTIGVNLAFAAGGNVAFDETTAALGDRYRIGTVVVKVT